MMASAKPNFVLVAAIDFGTTFSGYAFSFIATDGNKDLPEKIRTNKSWGASLGFQSYKSPTSVLINNAGKFLDFGYDAEKTYGEALEEDEDAKPNILLFRHFKMMLHKRENVSSKATIASVDGTIRPALDIFSHAIRYLKDHLLDAIKLETGSNPNPDLIRWVITVPAIWIDESKQFMREATFRAGCITQKDSRNLVIALEPEAASLCCRRLGIAQYDSASGIEFPKGTKYMVLDCGGGTIDITVHEMEFDKKVKEVLKASGGPWGGTEVDRNFIELMERALGKNFLNTLIKNHPHEWLQFLTNFERSKKAFKADSKSRITLTLSFNMITLFAEMNKGKRIDKHLKEGSCEGVTFGNGMIVINSKATKALFDPVIESVIQHTKELLTDTKTNGLKYIFMVGGFSECQLLQDEIKRQFEKNGLKVLIPSEAQLAIIKGAVLFGHQPEEISTRVSGLSYGFERACKFDSKIHDEKRKTMYDEKAYCSQVFTCMIRCNEEIKRGKVITQTCLPATKDSTVMDFPLFAIDGPPTSPLQYTDDENVINIGKVSIELSGKGLDREVEFSVTFGDTEVQFEAKDLKSGNKASTTIDFLHK